ncbi:PSD1 and planctomycete cytochrome C domain-containing protein [Neorhodopirellula lusitana]|uniref:PSD1 and planctomycete cytochrome C domain-containing protein n=1 Tax=Neorhodopirellula lusitana TaxID=445327 RepID=UPI00384CAF3E
MQNFRSSDPPEQNGANRLLLVCLCLACWSFVSIGPTSAAEDETVDFSSQVRPILSDRCFHCHGPDADNQDSAFRLDSQEHLLEDLGGYAGVVPGDLDASELITRIRSEDESDMMPPPDSNRSLSDEEKQILERWVAQGAAYEGHWAFQRPDPDNLPTDVLPNSNWSPETVKRWSNNPIDAFIARKLVEHQLAPSPPADPATRLRRVAMTLTGRLPSEDIQRRFLADPTDLAFAEAVDELMSTMHYAERQTLLWLDAARYADTDGYQNDSGRTNWPWRDWVIQAFHNNMPFDQFTIQQLAGDMLPDATDGQRLATAFNRNHRQNAEGGALADEFFVENVIDRVETTGTVFLGLTMGCTRCHDHKYDPISQREFYQFYGYFNNIGERGIGRGVDAKPTLPSLSPMVEVKAGVLDKIAQVDLANKAVSQANKTFDKRMNEWIEQTRTELQSTPETQWESATIRDAQLVGDGELLVNDDTTVEYRGDGVGNLIYAITLSQNLTGTTSIRLNAIVDERFGAPNKRSPSENGNFVLTDCKIAIANRSVPVAGISASFEQSGYEAAKAIDSDPASGWAISGSDPKAESVSAELTLKKPIDMNDDEAITVTLHFASPFPKHVIGKLAIDRSDAPIDAKQAKNPLSDQIKSLLLKSADKRSNRDRNQIRNFYRKIDEPTLLAKRELDTANRELTAHAGPRVSVMVMNEREGTPQPAYLLDRGQYDQPLKDDPLPRGVPAALLASPDAAQPKDRLELARWIVSADNPLTARVTVNRIWQSHFGVGLVKTSEDFGLQGEMPSHPKLLDWLAVRFIDSGWDVQAMHRLIVTSAAFGQTSKQNNQLQEMDPSNRLVCRGPRYRADGFVIRDIALQVAGIANDRVGGPSVKPYQPSGLWESVAANAGTRYTPDKGDNLYRKSMYSYWKRAVNPPRQTIFDASGREVCNVRVRRTNTPLQALVLMNDPTFIEAARNLAERVLKTGASQDVQLEQMAGLAIAKRPAPSTLKIMANSLDYYRQYYADDPDAAKALLAIGDSKPAADIAPDHLAAMTAVAHLILNTDEFVTVE